MSDSEESGVTYTDIYSPFEELSDIGSPSADDHEYLIMLEDPYVEVALQAPPSPDYMPDPEEPEQVPPLPDYVPGLAHTDNEIVAEDQPYAEDASPIAQSPEYEDDEMDVEADEEEEEEHPAPADSVVVAPTAADQAAFAEETEPFETDDPIRSLGYRAAMIRLRDEVASTLPPPSQLPSASRREDRPEVTLPPQK
nr:hypothetical protein [Tanacetum cinerariifolium]